MNGVNVHIQSHLSKISQYVDILNIHSIPNTHKKQI